LIRDWFGPGILWGDLRARPACARAVGEVYVSQGGTLRVLLLFDEEWFYWKPKLPVKFAREFAKAYKAANGLRQPPAQNPHFTMTSIVPATSVMVSVPGPATPCSLAEFDVPVLTHVPFLRPAGTSTW
jgi:hypothetical protein